MPQLPLDVLNALALLEQQRSVAVAKAVKGEVRGQLGLLQHMLEDLGHVGVIVRRADARNEHPLGHFAPALFEGLLFALEQQLPKFRSQLAAHVHRATVPALGRADLPTGKVARNAKLAGGQVHVLPLEREGLTGPESGAGKTQQQGIVIDLVLGRSLQEVFKLLTGEGLDFVLTLLGLGCQPKLPPQLVGGVVGNDAVINGRVEHGPKRRVNEAHAVTGEIVIGLLYQQLLDLRLLEHPHLDRP